MSEVLDLPAITTVPLGDLLTDIRNGLVVEQEKELPGIPITRIETISKGTVDMDRVRYVRDTAGKSLDNFWLKKGDILFSHINSDLHLGKTALVLSDAPLLHGMNLLRLRVDSSRLRPKYLHHWLDYCRRSGVFMAIAQHAVNQSSLNQKKITSLEVPLRSVGEQDEIVAELEKQFSRLDEAVANLQRVKANLKRYKASVLKAAVEGRLVETEANLARREGRTFESGEQLLQRILEERRGQWQKKTGYKEPPQPALADQIDLPAGWTWACVEQLNPGNRPCAYGVLQPGEDLANGVPFVRVGDINDGMVDFSDMKRIHPDIAAAYPRTYLKGGEVLLTLVGAIGRTAVAPNTLAGANVARAVGVLPISESVDPHWVEMWFRNPAKIAEMTGKSHEVARKTLNLEDVRLAAVALPPRPEQTRIVAEVDRHLSIIREVEAEVDANLQRAQALRQAALAKAFSNY